MTNTFDDTGITLDSLSEVRTGLIAKFKAKFGDNIKTDDKSVFGQLIGIFAEVISDQNDLIQKAVNAFNPLVASGAALDNLVSMNGIRRKSSEYSTVVLKCTANTRGCTIPAGSIVSNPETGDKFITDIELVLTSSADGTVSATAQVAGDIAGGIGSITKIETPVLGWQECTNEAIVTVGKDRETNIELRLRRRMASGKTGLCSVSSLYTALFNLDNVTNVAVYDKEDPIYGLPANYVWCVIRGGSDNEIAETLFNNIAGGILTFGSSSVVYSDSVTGKDYTMLFSRASELQLRLKIDITTTKAFPSNGYDLIKQNLIDFIEGRYIMPDGTTAEGITIGDSILFSRLFTPIMAVPGHYINHIALSFDADPELQSNLSTGKNEIATLAAEDITFV
jgi:hypothetical protein